MRVHIEVTFDTPPVERLRRPRKRVAVAALMAALLLPAVAVASHQFTDVPTAHTFHTNISNLAGAGVTAGCGGGKYCPDQAVTRGQMAGFLNRGLGRIAEAEVFEQVTGTDEETVGTVQITPGTSVADDASQFVRAQFTGHVVFTDVTGCPCMLRMSGTAGGQTLSTNYVVLTVSEAGAHFPITFAGVVNHPGSGRLTVELTTNIGVGGGLPTAYTVAGALIADTVPFGSRGSDTP
jgi:S-layer homology domain